MSLRNALVLGVLLPPLVGGCESPPAPVGVVVTDSSGVEVVSNLIDPSALPLRTLNEAPEREIADEALYQVTALLPLDRDQVAVGVSSAGSVRIYDEDGVLVRTLGRRGEGPGEFQQIGDLGRVSEDSLFVYDPSLRRITVFSADGQPGRTLPLPDLAPDPGWSRVLELDDGLAFVAEAGLSPRESEGVFRESGPSYRIDLDGNVVTTYGEFPGLEFMFGGGLMGPAPFGARLVTASLDDQLVVGTGERPELRFFGPDGTLSRVIRWTDQERAVTQGRMDRYVEFLLSQVSAEEAAVMRDRVGNMPFASQRPTLAALLIRPADGTLWVEEYPGPEASLPNQRGPARQWIVVDPAGEIRGRIGTPEGFVPFTLHEDRVWGVYRDDLGVESVRAYSTLRIVQ